MKKDLFIAAALVIFCVCFFGFNLADLSHLKGDENYYFSSARHMLMTGDWVTPRYHHHIRFEKPPFYYWAVAGFFNAFGVSWLSARMTSVVMAALTILLAYFLVLRLFGRGEALFSVLALSTTELFFRHARLCISDMTFLFLITFSLFLFVRSYKTKSDLCFILSFIPMGLSLLTKGPLGPALIIITMGVFLIARRKALPVLKPKNIAFGALVFFAATLPWIIAMTSAHKENFLRHIWSVEIIGKLLIHNGNRIALAESAWPYIASLGYYVPVILISFLPWSAFLPFALTGKKNAKFSDGRAFILSWFWAVFILFSAAGFKHTHYMLAIAPPLAVLLGVYINGLCEKKPGLKKIFLGMGFLCAVFYLVLSGVIFPAFDDGAMRVYSLKIAGEIKEGDKIGMASHQFNIKKLGVHLNNLVFSPRDVSGDDLARYTYINKQSNLVPLLKSNGRIFVLITKDDYDEYVPAGLRERVHILEKHDVWNKSRFKKPDMELFKLLARGNFDALKKESYLISNRR